jgi:hypothetical protein
MRFYFTLFLLAIVSLSCLKSSSNTVPKANFLIKLDLMGETNAAPVSMFDGFLSVRSFSKDGGLYDNRHILRGMSYQKLQRAFVIVGVGEGPKIKLLTINGWCCQDATKDFEKLFHDLETEVAKRFPQRHAYTQFEPALPNKPHAANSCHDRHWQFENLGLAAAADAGR